MNTNTGSVPSAQPNGAYQLSDALLQEIESTRSMFQTLVDRLDVGLLSSAPLAQGISAKTEKQYSLVSVNLVAALDKVRLLQTEIEAVMKRVDL